MNSSIISQIHIPDYDVQGNLTKEDKLEIIDISSGNLRANNPDSYLILTGHGHRPSKSTLELYDDVYWNDKCEPLDRRGCVIGMPAQYKYVYEGIKRRKSDFVLKTRGDCIIGRENIFDWCLDIINKEKKEYLVTQMTATKPYKMGDCFMFGPGDKLERIWKNEKGVFFEPDGVVNTGRNFCYVETGNSECDNWDELVRQKCSFRDITTISFIDLRWNFHLLKKNSDIDKWFEIDDSKYYWGKTNGWHNFDGGDDSIRFDGTCYTEKIFYDN